MTDMILYNYGTERFLTFTEIMKVFFDRDKVDLSKKGLYQIKCDRSKYLGPFTFPTLGEEFTNHPELIDLEFIDMLIRRKEIYLLKKCIYMIDRSDAQELLKNMIIEKNSLVVSAIRSCGISLDVSDIIDLFEIEDGSLGMKELQLNSQLIPDMFVVLLRRISQLEAKVNGII
jgi:hypothetical protein